jgi:hypothetical protein
MTRFQMQHFISSMKQQFSTDKTEPQDNGLASPGARSSSGNHTRLASRAMAQALVDQVGWHLHK